MNDDDDNRFGISGLIFLLQLTIDLHVIYIGVFFILLNSLYLPFVPAEKRLVFLSFMFILQAITFTPYLVVRMIGARGESLKNKAHNFFPAFFSVLYVAVIQVGLSFIIP